MRHTAILENTMTFRIAAITNENGSNEGCLTLIGPNGEIISFEGLRPVPANVPLYMVKAELVAQAKVLMAVAIDNTDVI
jgi:hypothetical protein